MHGQQNIKICDDSCVTEEVRNRLDGLVPARFPLCIRSQTAHRPLTVSSRIGKMCLRSRGDVKSSFHKDYLTNIFTTRGHVCYRRDVYLLHVTKFISRI